MTMGMDMEMDVSCMDPSSRHNHQQEMLASQSLDSILVSTKSQSKSQEQQQEKKARPIEEAPKCPRCDSSNTKFCYYNNYSLSQPRYFCKSCRRYWTKGGTLRNVPVGGGCRKNRRFSSSSRKSSPDHDQQHHLITTIPTSTSSPNSILISPFDQFHHLDHANSDLTLAIARMQKQVGGSMGFDHLENHANISLLSGNSHFDLFGNSFLDPTNNGLHPMYYRVEGNGNLGNVENSRGNSVNINNHDQYHDEQMVMQFNQEMLSNPSSSSSTPTIKQEIGFPWKVTSNEDNYLHGGNTHELDSLKETWNSGVIGSSWFSLLNSPII